MHPYFISCDWGTSSFRLRLVTLPSCHILHEITSSQGIAATYQAFVKHTAAKQFSEEERLSFYKQYISDQIQLLAQQASFPLDGISVIISGMASSSIGMLELPYASLPFSLDGSSAIIHTIPATPAFSHDILLISGLKSMQDVMRGEETQIMGLATVREITNAICIFPGTHSKHIYVKDGYITAFRTYMTGEIFQTIASHTILQASVEKGHLEEHAPGMMQAFRRGVKAGMELQNILHALFTVRTGELFKERTKQENYFYLSGLLIGYELQDLVKQPQTHIHLCSSSHLLRFYQQAAEVLRLTANLAIISGELIDQSAIRGQWKIWHLTK